jgi:hypothetical protein
MIESTARRMPQSLEIDLLPWADPYITQLFEEAELLGHSSLTGFVLDWPTQHGDRRVQHEVKSPCDCHSRPISRPVPRLAPRTRRTESARTLARC